MVGHLEEKIDCYTLPVYFTVDSINIKKESKVLMYSKNLHHHNYSLHDTLPPRLIMNVKFSITFLSNVSSIQELGEENEILEFNPKEGS